MSDDPKARDMGRELIASIHAQEAAQHDPARTWRQAMSTSAQLRETQTDFEDTIDDLKRTQSALAASQADLTAMDVERDSLAVLNAELRVENDALRAAVERHVTQLGELGRDLATLTDQQLACLRLAAQGCTRTEIARTLHLSEKTIGNYMHAILVRLAARNTAHAVAIAIGLGLIPAGTGGAR